MENTLNKFTFAGVILLASITGCHHNSDSPGIVHGERFIDDDQPTCVGRLDQAEIACGAQADAMLYDMNFHGNTLNALGQVKLDLIRKATPAGDPVVVYLNMPHDLIAAREMAVGEYLKTSGLLDTQISMIEGPNLNPSTPTAYNLTGLYKPDGATFNGQAAIDPNAASGPAAGITSK